MTHAMPEDYKALALAMAEPPYFTGMAVVEDTPDYREVGVCVEVKRPDGGTTDWWFQVAKYREANDVRPVVVRVAFFGGDFEVESDVPPSVMTEFNRVHPDALKLLNA